jgi:probable HAF family extracellular repeat protein
VVTNSTTASFVARDTAVSQQYSTTVKAVLNGSQTVYQQTFALPYSDPTVQAAVTMADSMLQADNANPGSPILTSNSTVPSGQTSYALVRDTTLTGNQTVVTSTTFGPALIAVGEDQDQLFFVISGQTDINVNTDNEYYVDRNVISPSTNVTTQVYEIDGTSSTALCKISGLQQLLNEALGRASPVDDLNSDARVNVVDVEIEIQALLGGSCQVSQASSAEVLRALVAANDRGEVVGSAGGHAVLLTHARLIDLGTLGGPESAAVAIDSSGRVVGWSDTATGERHAFFWVSDRMIDLNHFVTLPENSMLVEATAIDDQGQIVALGNDGKVYRFDIPAGLR